MIKLIKSAPLTTYLCNPITFPTETHSSLSLSPFTLTPPSWVIEPSHFNFGMSFPLASLPVSLFKRPLKDTFSISTFISTSYPFKEPNAPW